MLAKQKLDRINVLAKKKKNDAITEDELKELKALREEYLKNFRSSFKKQIESTTVIDPEGNDVTPEKLKSMKNNNTNR